MLQRILPALNVYFHPKLIAVLFLGFVSGLPLALTGGTLSIWLTETGINFTTIGLFAAVGIPYSFKFLWSPIVDGARIPFFSNLLGQRRAWMIATQLILIGVIIALGMSDPIKNIWLTAILAFSLATISATQDIVIDAYRVELLTADQQASGAALTQLGYRMGMLLSGAGALFLAEATDWQTTYIVMAACIIVGIITVLITGEPAATVENTEKESTTEWFTHHVINPFLDFGKHKEWLIILLFILFYKFGDAFAGVMTNTFLISLEFTKSEIATVVKGVGLIALFIGLFIGGAMVKYLGYMRSLWIAGILQMLSNLIFIAQAHMGHNLWFLAVTISVENLCGGMGSAVFVGYISALCNVGYTATQYALLSSLASVGRTFLSTPSGWFVTQLGWVKFFILSTFLAIPGLLLLFILIKKREQNRVSRGSNGN